MGTKGFLMLVLGANKATLKKWMIWVYVWGVSIMKNLWGNKRETPINIALISILIVAGLRLLSLWTQNTLVATLIWAMLLVALIATIWHRVVRYHESRKQQE